MTASWRRATVCAVFLVAAAGVGAQGEERAGVPQAVDLDAVLRLALERSPRIALEQAGVAQAEAERVAAGAYPNPVVSYGRLRPSGGQATLFEGSRQEDVGVGIPLLVAGQRAARIDRAEREIEAARARVAAGASTLAGEAGAAFVALLAAQEIVALRMAAVGEVTRLRDIVAGREVSGAASRYDVARLDVELGGLRAKAQDAQADVADRSGLLATLLGLPGWRPTAVGALAPLPAGAVPQGSPEGVAEIPVVVAAEREEAAARSAIEVARRERWPVPSVNVGRTWTSDPYGGANFIGLSVEVPLLDTRRGALLRAEADAHAAAVRRQIVSAETSATLRRLREVIAVRQGALRRFDEEAAGRLAPLRAMAEDAYRLGRASVLELLDATRSRNELQQTRVELLANLVEAQVRLRATLGELGPATPAR
jgi:cobalt-zinc-cadmium efflux system outer membrane protein